MAGTSVDIILISQEPNLRFDHLQELADCPQFSLKKYEPKIQREFWHRLHLGVCGLTPCASALGQGRASHAVLAQNWPNVPLWHFPQKARARPQR
jgi:hypothetical protein